MSKLKMMFKIGGVWKSIAWDLERCAWPVNEQLDCWKITRTVLSAGQKSFVAEATQIVTKIAGDSAQRPAPGCCSPKLLRVVGESLAQHSDGNSSLHLLQSPLPQHRRFPRKRIRHPPSLGLWIVTTSTCRP
jgi:hypothetical protein